MDVLCLVSEPSGALTQDSALLIWEKMTEHFITYLKSMHKFFCQF